MKPTQKTLQVFLPEGTPAGIQIDDADRASDLRAAHTFEIHSFY